MDGNKVTPKNFCSLPDGERVCGDFGRRMPGDHPPERLRSQQRRASNEWENLLVENYEGKVPDPRLD